VPYAEKRPGPFAQAGSIPSEFGTLVNMTDLWLHNNKLTGTPPFAHFAPFATRLAEKDLHFVLAGSIPTEFGELINLTDLRLFGNNLNGTPHFTLFCSPVYHLHTMNHQRW
jgi:hypothetical protein